MIEWEIVNNTNRSNLVADNLTAGISSQSSGVITRTALILCSSLNVAGLETNAAKESQPNCLSSASPLLNYNKPKLR